MRDPIIKRVVTTSTWAASTDMTPVDLPREGLVTEVTFRGLITCTLTATALSEFWRRVLQNIRLEGDGGKAFLGMSGQGMSRLLMLWNEVVMGMPTIHSNGAGIALAGVDVGSTTFTIQMKFHPGSNPRDPFDLTAAIPAKALATFQAILTTAAAAVCDGSADITAGTFSYEVCQVLGIPVRAGLMVPQGSTLSYPHSANFSDYSKDIDVPAGAFLRSIILLIQDDTAITPLREDDEVTGVKLKKPKSGDYVFAQNINELKATMMSRFAVRGIGGEVGPIGAVATTRPAPTATMDIVPAGFVVIDLRPYGHPLYGLDLRGYQTGDFKLGLTIENYAAGDDTIIYWDQLNPVEAQYVGKGG